MKITKEITVLKLFRLGQEPQNYNWLKGLIGISSPDGYVPAEVSHRHFLYWKKEMMRKQFRNV